MGRALWIPDFVRDYGLEPVIIDGWDRRGDDYFDPRVLLWHHTAGAPTGWCPSLGIVINGRSGLPGPLAQTMLARDGRVPVVASGRANHAGAGSWRGVVGNSSAMGIEAESSGRGDWTSQQRDAYPKLAAALTEGMTRHANDNCGHKEWAPSRKIDPAGIDMNDSRWAVGVLMLGEKNQEKEGKVVAPPEGLNAKIVDSSPDPDGRGYWLLGADGGVFGFKAEFIDAAVDLIASKDRAVAIEAHPGGKGYWIATAKGAVFAFGPRYYGGMFGKQLAWPITNIMSTVSGKGYWLVAEDGGVFAFGDAKFEGAA